MTLKDEIIHFGKTLSFIDSGQKRKIVTMLLNFFERNWGTDKGPEGQVSCPGVKNRPERQHYLSLWTIKWVRGSS